MKRLILLLMLASPAAAQTVTPNFTQGSMNSTTTTTVDIERTIETETLWWRLFVMEWLKRYTQLRYCWRQYNLFRNNGWRSLVSRDHNPISRSCGDNRHHRNNRTKLYYYLALYLLAVTPAFAEEDPKVQNTSNPVAAATGNVTNQNVNIQNSGAPSRQFFAANSNCNGATLQATPLLYG